MTSAIIILLVLILLNGLLVTAEIALVAARKTRLEVEAQLGNKLAGLALENSLAPGRFLSTIQIGITLIGIMMGVFSEEIAGGLNKLFREWGFSLPHTDSISLAIAVFLATFASIVIGELVPKQIGLSNPEGISKALARPIHGLAYLLHPFAWTLSRCSDTIIRLLGIKASSGSKVTEEEIRAMVMEGTEGGEVQEIEQNIVERVFHLGDRKISSLMTHHSDLVWLDVNDPPERLREKIASELHSVYPVCEGDLDEVVGVVNIKDLVLRDVCHDQFNIADQIQPAQFVPETLTAYATLELFKRNKIHYGLIVDEYGSTVGMVTLNDILEALVGDFNEPSPDEPQIIRREDNTWLADGDLSFYEFVYEFDIKGFDSGKIKFDTLAGLAISVLKHIPHPGEKFTWHSFEFEIVDLDGNRVDKLIIRKLEEPESK